MLPIRNISYLLPMCCSFWEKCKNSPKTGLECSTPLMTHVFAHGAHLPPLLFSTLLVWWRGEKTRGKDIHKWSTKPTTNTLMAHLCSRAYKNNAHQTGGGIFAKIVRGCACWTSKTFSIPIFRTIIHPSVTILLVPFRKKSTQFHSNWVLFTVCSK